MARFLTLMVAALTLFVLAPDHARADELDARIEALPSSQVPCSSSDPHNCRAKESQRLPISRADKAWASEQAKGCERNDAAACYRLGRAYRLGVGVRSNRAIAQKLFAQACDADQGDACMELADLQRRGGNIGQLNGQFALHQRGCQLNALAACDALADDYLGGEGVGTDATRGEALLRDGCARGFEQSCSNLAQRLIQGWEIERNEDEAIVLLDAQCRRGYAQGCTNAGSLLRDLPQHADLRADFLNRACDLKEGESCYTLGLLRLAEGRDAGLALLKRACGLKQYYCGDAEIVEAEPGMAAACNSGDFAVCDRLGDIYGGSTIALRDDAKSMASYVRACDGGLMKSCGNAAYHIFTIEGQNSAPAARYLDRGCSGGNDEACISLADVLAAGGPVPADPPRAAEIYARICAKGDTFACDKQAELAERFADVPVPNVDHRFTEPEDPRAAVAMPQAAEFKTCETHREKFRGEVFTDTVCNSTPASIGSRVMTAGAAPWQALISRPETVGRQKLSGPERVLCGGSLIAKGWILTAAHCLYGDGLDFERAGYTVRLGLFRSYEDEGYSYRVLQAIPFPQYRRAATDKAFDIALVRYDYRNPVQLGPVQSIRAIRLDPQPVGKRRIARRMPVYSYGWGWTELVNSQAANELRGVKMELLDEPTCTRQTGFTGDRQNIVLCAGGRNNEQACFGDSGGPLVFYGDADKVPTLIGVVSAGRKCGTTGEASRYSRVASVREWIDQTIGGTTAR
jgi:TPR repeat protein